MNILETNLNLLCRSNQKLAMKIKNHNDFKSQFSLEESMSGDPLLKRNNIFLNDKVDPEQEAINLLNKVENKGSAGFNFIYGLGLGYVLKRFNKAIEGYIIVYEPDLDVLRLVFEMVDFTDELSNNRVFIVDSIDAINELYPKYFFHDYTISTTISNVYRSYDFDNAEKFIKELGYVHGLYLSNYQTYWNKHHSWVNSLIRNLNYLPKYNEVKTLKNKFKNKPAIVISAGPSLDKTIELIAQIQDKFVIYCVGTALKSAIKFGVKPDFICFVEYLAVTARMLDETDLAYSNIILQPTTCKDIYEANVKNKFLFYADNDEAAKWVAKKFNINQNEYINRGTVSVNALVSAKIMGCNPIILVGQDLAYTNNKCYADGSIYDNYLFQDDKVVVGNMQELLNKTHNTEEIINRRVANLTKDLYKVKGQNGETLWAPGDYASFIKYFTEIANNYSSTTKLINCSPGGAQIDGYENMLFSDVISNYAKDILDKNIEKLSSLNPQFENIIKDEIRVTVDIFDHSFKTVFDEALGITSKMDEQFKDIDENAKNSIYLEYLPALLEYYKKIRSLKTTDLFNLLISRNTYFSDFYLNKIDYNQHKLALAKILYLLFNSDYKDFIIPIITQLKALNI